jgi:hypothetical protein
MTPLLWALALVWCGGNLVFVAVVAWAFTKG